MCVLMKMSFGSGAGWQAYHLHGGTVFFACVGVCYCIIFLHTQHHTLFLLTPCCKLFLITFHAKQIKKTWRISFLKSPANFILNLHREFCEWQSAAATDAPSAVEHCILPPSNCSLFVGHKRCEHTSPKIRGWNRRPKPAAPLHNVLYIWSC